MLYVLYQTNYPLLKIKIPRLSRMNKKNEPQLVYALHMLHSKHEYDLINDAMILLKHIDKTTLCRKNNYKYKHNTSIITHPRAIRRRAQTHMSADL
jgi:hypothetical protein